MLSPVNAAALLLYLILMTLPLNVPESNTPVTPSEPIGMCHKYPEAAPVVVVAIGSAGAVYLYTREPQISLTVAMAIVAGANGAPNNVLVNLVAFAAPNPQPDV
jgi:hypothetical protein